MNLRKHLFPLLLPLLLLTSCGSKKSTTTGETGSLSDSLKFIKIADTKDFLPGWSKENNVIYQWIAEPDMLHPVNSISIQRTEIFLYTHIFLVMVDFRTRELIPMLAKSLPSVSDDGLRVTFELRDEPKWDDGEMLSVDDVIFTAKASKCPFTDNPNYKP